MSFRFVQLADPQFGMFSRYSGSTAEELEAFARAGHKVKAVPPSVGFAEETRLFGEAIDRANDLNPAFVVVCGDMVHDPASLEQRDEVLRIAGNLNPDIPIHWVAGNHDVAADTVVPTPESLQNYREVWGDDYYAFQHEHASFITLNSSVLAHPGAVQDELHAEMQFLETELKAAQSRGSKQIILFTHYPLFIEDLHEPDEYFSIPTAQRIPLVKLLHEYGVSTAFAGHWHRNNYASDGDLQIIATGAVGYPLGDDPSGYRVVEVAREGVTHTYYPLGAG